MEEDIIRIEEIKKEYSTMDGLKEYVKAIENILNRLEQLEKENKKLKGKYNIQPVLVNNSMFFIDNELYENLLVDINKNYIPKSVIRDMFKKIDNCTINFDNSYYVAWGAVENLLKGILGDE